MIVNGNIYEINHKQIDINQPDAFGKTFRRPLEYKTGFLGVSKYDCIKSLIIHLPL